MLDVLTPPRGLPQSEESERAVLAAVLLDPRLLAAVSGRLRAYRPPSVGAGRPGFAQVFRWACRSYT